jgi:hypothetical protein
MKRTCVWLILLTASVPAVAQEPAVQRVLRQFETAKPTERSMAFYSLDWVANLADAKSRALKEQRPIFLILNTNITAGTNLYSGHT